MTNLSLKEQLQALSEGLSSVPTGPKPSHNNSNNKKKHSGKPRPQAQQASVAKPVKQKPAWLEHAQYGVELLKAYYSNCFKEAKDIQPLKVGIKQDLVKHLSTLTEVTTTDKACMVSSLAYYVNSLSYHKSVVAGAVRIDLEGNPAGVVSAEEAQYSAETRQAKLQKKQGSKQNQAIENPA